MRLYTVYQNVDSMYRNRLPRITKKYRPKGRRNQENHSRDFRMCEIRTAQQVAQLHDSLLLLSLLFSINYIIVLYSGRVPAANAPGCTAA